MGTYAGGNVQNIVYSSIAQNSKKLETIQMLTNKYMVMYLHKGIPATKMNELPLKATTYRNTT